MLATLTQPLANQGETVRKDGCGGKQRSLPHAKDALFQVFKDGQADQWEKKGHPIPERQKQSHAGGKCQAGRGVFWGGEWEGTFPVRLN